MFQQSYLQLFLQACGQREGWGREQASGIPIFGEPIGKKPGANPIKLIH